MENSLKVSIIIPAYNASSYLSEALVSVCAQTYKNTEIIVVNDGSTDHTGQIAEKKREEDARIRVIHTENGGVSRARNIGLEKASGEYIFFLDADDYLENEALEEYVKEAEKRQADVVTAPYFELVKNKERRVRARRSDYISEIEKYGTDPLRLFLHTDFISWAVWGKLIRKECIGTVRFSETLRIGEDLMFTEQIMENCRCLGILSQPWYVYQLNDMSVMNRGFSEKNLDMLKALEDIYQRLRRSEYQEAAKGFYLKYNIWFYGFFLRNCPRKEKMHYTADMERVLESIRRTGYKEAWRMLGKKKRMEYLSIKWSPSFYALWISGAYRIRNGIWSVTRRG